MDVIMDECRTLKEYVMHVEHMMSYVKQMLLTEAVEKAADECIAEGILSEFFACGKTGTRPAWGMENNKEENKLKSL